MGGQSTTCSQIWIGISTLGGKLGLARASSSARDQGTPIYGPGLPARVINGMNVTGYQKLTGETLTIKGLQVYPAGPTQTAQVGVSAVMRMRDHILAEAQAAGIARVIVEGVRITGANPRRPVNFTFLFQNGQWMQQKQGRE